MFCTNCGSQMSKEADSCPSCGHPNDVARKGGKKSKVGFVILALLLGGLGIHRMYMNTPTDWVLGIMYLVLFLVGFGIVPVLIALLEAIVIGFRKNDERFN